MRQSTVTRRHREPERWLEQLPLDPRDVDVVRAKRLVRAHLS